MPCPLRCVLIIAAFLFPQVCGAADPSESHSAAQLVVQAFPLSERPVKLEPEVLDRRYAPRRHQACIGLPDDPFKTIVGSDGGLYYDYGKAGPQAYNNGEGRFGTRLQFTFDAPGEPTALRQSLLNARTPLVITEQTHGTLRLRQEAWATAKFEGDLAERSATRIDYLRVTVTNDSDAPREGQLVLHAGSTTGLHLDERRTALRRGGETGAIFCRFAQPCEPLPAQPAADSGQAGLAIASELPLQVQRDWAHPRQECSPVFRHVMIGWNQPLSFTFPSEGEEKYWVALGVIEGWHAEAGKRPLRIRVEGAAPRDIDPVRAGGKNVPIVVTSLAFDENRDGKVSVGVWPIEGAEDGNTILSGLWVFPGESAPDNQAILAGQAAGGTLAFVDADHAPDAPKELSLVWKCRLDKRGDVAEWTIAIPQGTWKTEPDVSAAGVESSRQRAIAYWRDVDLPYDRIRVPDPAVQDQLDSCIRNIYQAREIRDGRPAFQVGPTCYRGTWAADGPFILEAVTYLGRADEVRAGLEQQVDGDSGPGGVGFSKKSGLRLWMIRRHFQLTGDRQWLHQMWPRVEREVGQIIEYRKMTRSDPNQANFGLMPIGFGDGGLGGQHREYTNVYWTLAGLKAAIAMAHDSGSPEAAAWQAEYQDYWAAFERARQRDQLKDEAGNVYVPVTMRGEQPQLPQCGAWAFLQSIYPGQVFASDDRLMLGTMAMLDATEREGLIFGTGWLPDGIWNYAASFYAHAHLWLGHGRKAAATFYAMGNHACPLLCWREEQSLVDEPQKYVGDMPHNWASAEFIRLARHLLVLERGQALHLLEGLPRAWTRPGSVTQVLQMPTTFGPVDLKLRVADDGKSATVHLVPPRLRPATKVIVHLESFERGVKSVSIDGASRHGTSIDSNREEPIEIRVLLKSEESQP